MLNIRFAKDHLLHRLTAKTRHGTHSPFVYNLIDTVIYDNNDKKVYHEIENISGHTNTHPKITISVTPKRARLLYRLVAHFRPQTIIEIGITDRIVRLYLQKAAPEAKITHIPSVGQLDEISKPDMFFLNLSVKHDALKYFEHCLPKVHENALLIVNDIYRSKAIKTTWAAIKANPQVTITIDLFWFGLVFFKKGQAKEDFKIKMEPGFLGF